MKFIALCALVLLLVLAGLLGYWFSGHQVAPSSLSKLERGMSQAEVLQILGEPTRVERTAQYGGSERWHYKPQRWKFCGVILSFDPAGRYMSIFHDH